MLLIGLSSLLIAIGISSAKTLYSSTINSTAELSRTSLNNKKGRGTIDAIHLTRITAIILLFSAVLSFNQAISSSLLISDQHGLGLFSGLFHVTSVTQFMEVFLFVVGALVLLPWPTITTKTERIPEYSLIVLFTTIGASFLISSIDLVSMYLSLELQSFAVYILAAIYRNSESATSAGLKYFLLGALSSALILLGSSIIYAYTGLTGFDGIYMIANAHANDNSISHAIVLGLMIIGVGFLFKVAAAPFHNWAPDVYDGVPTIVTTWLTIMPKISLFVFLLELQLGQFVQIGLYDLETSFLLSDYNVWKNLLLTTSLLSLIIGTVVGLAQYRLKRLLAFSTISHVGFLLLALSVNSEESITSFLFYLMQYSLTNVNAFFVILALGYIIHRNSPRDITVIAQLKGQFYANPLLGLSLALCLFSMAGVPPLMGFFAKYMVLYSAIENGYYFISIIGILTSVISAAYYLRIIRVIHFDSYGSDLNKSEVSVSSTHSYVIAVLTLLMTLFILSPSLLLNSSNLLALSLFTA